jgi:hypothetical protein
VFLNGFQIQCVALDPDRNGLAYCETFGHGLFRSEGEGRTWAALSGLKEPNVMALAVADGAVYAGTELSALYRSDDGGEPWHALHTLMSLPSAKTWSFPPRGSADGGS